MPAAAPRRLVLRIHRLAGCEGRAPTDLVLREHDWRLGLVRQGHKTGFYLDQRDSRQTQLPTPCAAWVAARAQLLLLHRRFHGGGARAQQVLSIDSSARAGAGARQWR